MIYEYLEAEAVGGGPQSPTRPHCRYHSLPSMDDDLTTFDCEQSMASRKRVREDSQVEGGIRDSSARSRCELCGVGPDDCSIQL
jgi:hypothetical protein